MLGKDHDRARAHGSPRGTRAAVCAALAVLYGVAASAETGGQDATSWLAGMRGALASVSYQGHIAYLRDHQIETLEVTHVVADGREQENMRSLNGPRKEVIRDKQQVICFFPDTHTGTIEKTASKRSFFPTLPDDLDQLGHVYQIDLAHEDYVAGRLTHAIAIEPRDRYRYARTIWVDNVSKLPLKLELRDRTGTVVEQMIFASVQITPNLPFQDTLALLQSPSVSWKTTQQETIEPDRLEWTFTGTPMGFRLVSYSRAKEAPASKLVDHIVLSDGLASVSVYIEPLAEGENAALAKKSIGAVNAYTRELKRFSVTVIGEVPKETVKAIADGIEHTPSSL